MSTNINFKKDHFTLVDGYFYMFDDETNVLYQRTSDGNTSFSSPLDTLLDNPVTSLEYDGANFWTLETTATNSLAIKRWKIQNYVCIQEQIINLNESVGHKYNADAFTLEHYHTTTSGTIPIGTDRIPVQDYWDKLSSGMTITIGPNSLGVSETLNVQAWETGVIVLADTVEEEYAYGTDVVFYTNIWLFNNYSGTLANTGALYKINAYTGSYITRYEAAEYKDITACTFYKIYALDKYGATDMLCYVKATNMLFIDVSGTGINLHNYGSMLLDNVEITTNKVIVVYDLAIEGDNIYKLQRKANYFGQTESYSYAQYNVATQAKIVTSISLLADPSIISANGSATTGILARVKDQFWQPISGRLVYFSHDETTTGDIIGGNPVNTNSLGEAGTIYKSGTKATEVKITAVIDQV